MAVSKKAEPKKVVKKVVEPVVESPKLEEKPKYEGPVCECGEPVAPGQTYVCQKHMRWN